MLTLMLFSERLNSWHIRRRSSGGNIMARFQVAWLPLGERAQDLRTGRLNPLETA